MLWLDNDEGAYHYYVDAVRDELAKGRKTLLSTTAWAIATAALGPQTGDGVSLDSLKIRWGAIARAMLETVKG